MMTVKFSSTYNGNPVALEYTDDSDRKQIELTYKSEFACLPETLIYGGDKTETLSSLVQGQLIEINDMFLGTLDEQTTEFYKEGYEEDAVYAFKDILESVNEFLKGVR